MTATEYVILVDEHDNETGIAEKLAAHEQKLLHRAFSVFVFRMRPKTQILELLLQQRALHKYHSPGLWTNTCCSHPRPGETVIAAGERRLFEEMGCQVRLKNIGSFRYLAHFTNGLTEHELDHVLVALVDEINIEPNPEEVNAWQWMPVDELQKRFIDSPQTYTAWIKEGLTLALSDLHASHAGIPK